MVATDKTTEVEVSAYVAALLEQRRAEIAELRRTIKDPAAELSAAVRRIFSYEALEFAVSSLYVPGMDEDDMDEEDIINP